MIALSRGRSQVRLMIIGFVMLLGTVLLAQDEAAFAIGDQVIVKGGPMTLYTRPAGGTRLTEMPDNTVTEIVAGPELVEGERWWYISNNFGWVAEIDSLGGEILPFDPAILEQSIAVATTTLNNDPNNIEALFRRGWAYFSQENYDAALADITAAIGLEPEKAEYYRARGKVHLDAGHYLDAIQDFSFALAFSPGDVAVYNRRGVALERLADYQSATLDYLSGLEIAPEYGLLYYNLGNAAQYSGNQYLALDYYEQAAAIDPYLYQVHIGRGYTYINIGDYSTAEAEFQESMRYFAHKYFPYAGLGTTYENMGQLELALDYYTQALTYDAENVFVYRSRGRLYYQLGRFEESADDLALAIDYAVDKANEYNSQGAMFNRLGDYAAAIERYTKTLEQEYRNSHWAFFNRGQAYRNLGQFNEAMADFDDALKLQPYFPAPYLARSGLLMDRGDYNEALLTLNRAIELFPTLAPLFYQRGILFEDYLNQPSLALSDYRQAAELNPYDPGYLEDLGDQYYLMGYDEDAIRVYEQYVNLIGDNYTERTPSILNLLASLRATRASLEDTQLQPRNPQPAYAVYHTAGQVIYGWSVPNAMSITLSLTSPTMAPMQISPEGSDVSDLSWSPDGQRIAFADPSGIYLMPPDGGTVSRLVTVSEPDNIQFSPSGRQIAYVAQGQIWLVNVDGGQIVNLTSGMGNYQYSVFGGYDWSADSRHLIFLAANSDSRFLNGILQIDTQTSDIEVIIPWPREDIAMDSPQMSPDGHYIALHVIGGIEGILIFNVQSGASHLLPATGYQGGFAWSPDSTHIAYNSAGGILVASVTEDSTPNPIAEGVGESQSIIGWRGDGRTLLFTACAETCEIFSIGLDGRGLEQLTNDGGLKFFAAVSPLSG